MKVITIIKFVSMDKTNRHSGRLFLFFSECLSKLEETLRYPVSEKGGPEGAATLKSVLCGTMEKLVHSNTEFKMESVNLNSQKKIMKSIHLLNGETKMIEEP